MAKVILDAGHGGPEPGAIYEGRQEKDDNLRLALAVGEILEQNGVEVAYTRTEDVYDTPFEKAQIANREGGDFLISFHRNSSPEANQYSGVETLVYDKSGDKVTLAENINEELEDVGYRNLGVKERPGLVILKRSQMPAVLVETGFLNTEADNALFDEQFDAIAQAIAEAVLDTVGERPDWMMEDEVMQNVVGESDQMMNDAPVQIKEKFYRVQTGAFKNRQYAEDMLYQLLKENYPAFLLYEAPYYKVQVGAFRQLDNAVRMEAALRKRGYATFLVSE
jgi:N-acetylmuramoyl-L-alanine amidase